MRIENNFKGHKIKKTPKLNYANNYLLVLKNKKKMMQRI